MNHDNELDDLLSHLLDGDGGPKAEHELDKFLKEHPEYLKRVREHLEVSEMLRQQAQEDLSDGFAEICRSHIESIENESPEDFPVKLLNRIWFRRQILAMGGLAAAVALFLGLATLWLKDKSDLAGTITYLDDFGEITSEAELHSGELLKVERGFARLHFASGAVFSVGSPSQLSINDSMHIEVYEGLVTGWCPPQAHGFKVDTANARLTDLGTSFGVKENSNSGSSNFLVFDGAVEIEKDGERVILTAEESLDVSTSFKRRSFDPIPFNDSWRICHGILNTSGNIVTCNADTPSKLITQKDDENLLLFPEARNQIISVPFRVDITEPGNHTITSSEETSILFKAPADARLDSYLLRSVPFSPQAWHTDHIRYTGSITFDTPILAVITGAKTLGESDQHFLHDEWPREDWPHLRGLEENAVTSPTKDAVRMSEDRKTLYLDFSTGAGSDEIRIITKAL